MAPESTNTNMRRTRRNRPPTFFWQGVLIVLPLAVLAALGLFSLRQDKVLAQHEATERAQRLADQLAQDLWAELTDLSGPNLPMFKVDRAGALIFPPASSSVPNPHLLNPAELTPSQEQIWRSVQQADVTNTAEFTTAFSGPSVEDFAATACYEAGLSLVHQDNAPAAAAMFQSVLERYPRALGETGLPLAPLAQLKLLELASQPTNRLNIQIKPLLESLCSNAVFNPSPVTPLLVSKASEFANTPDLKDTAADWQAEWTRHELSRKLFVAARPNLRLPPETKASEFPLLSGFAQASRTIAGSPSSKPSGPTQNPPRLFWINSDENWLAARVDEETNGFWIVCTSNPFAIWQRLTAPPERDERRPLMRVTYHGHNVPPRLVQPKAPPHPPVPIPPYFSASLELAGRTVISSNNLQMIVQLGGGKEVGLHWGLGPTMSAPPILAAARKVEDGIEYLRCNVHLISPQMLFVRQRQRTGLFGLLIAASAAAALVGFITARRAFYRQLRLVEMKSNFVSSVSHELRAPIASVRLMAEGLERGRVQEPSKQNEYYRFIVQECRRLSSMIENVLDFSRIEQGRKEYEFEPADLCALVEQTAKLMLTQAAERQIRLETIVTGDPISPEIDGRAIQQALVNLLDNALKHSPNESVIQIELEFPPGSAREEEPPTSPGPSPPSADGKGGETRNTQHASLLLSVTDHGEGIPSEEHERIFERFYRCGSELRRETQGVGIGLSIVKHIVEAHGGRVIVKSAVGQGSRFTMELPIKTATLQNPCHAF